MREERLLPHVLPIFHSENCNFGDFGKFLERILESRSKNLFFKPVFDVEKAKKCSFLFNMHKNILKYSLNFLKSVV